MARKVAVFADDHRVVLRQGDVEIGLEPQEVPWVAARMVEAALAVVRAGLERQTILQVLAETEGDGRPPA